MEERCFTSLIIINLQAKMLDTKIREKGLGDRSDIPGLIRPLWFR